MSTPTARLCPTATCSADRDLTWPVAWVPGPGHECETTHLLNANVAGHSWGNRDAWIHGPRSGRESGRRGGSTLGNLLLVSGRPNTGPDSHQGKHSGLCGGRSAVAFAEGLPTLKSNSG